MEAMLRFLRLATPLRHLSTTRTPQPSSEVPDVQSFLTKIGRNMSQYSGQFDTWQSLINARGKTLKANGLDVRDRRYLLGWIERFKQGLPLKEIRRGKKKWGGERNARANRAAFYGRKAAEERESQ